MLSGREICDEQTIGGSRVYPSMNGMEMSHNTTIVIISGFSPENSLSLMIVADGIPMGLNADLIMSRGAGFTGVSP